MRGLVVDYVGVLDGSDDDRARWRSLCTAMREKGIPIAILSNDDGGPGAEQIREWEYRGFVDAVLLSGEIGYEKPDVEAYRFAATTLGVDLRDLVLVDDSITNVQAAVEAGMIGVFYQQFERSINELAVFFELKGDI